MWFPQQVDLKLFGIVRKRKSNEWEGKCVR